MWRARRAAVIAKTKRSSGLTKRINRTAPSRSRPITPLILQAIRRYVGDAIARLENSYWTYTTSRWRSATASDMGHCNQCRWHLHKTGKHGTPAYQAHELTFAAAQLARAVSKRPVQVETDSIAPGIFDQLRVRQAWRSPLSIGGVVVVSWVGAAGSVLSA